jgi:BASS family bile acid:Na+ symporter
MNSERFTLLFPLWTLMGAGLALLYPPLFTWFRGDLITLGLGVIMLGMGLGLTPQDFVRVGQRPRPVVIGVVTQFVVMPSIAAFLAFALHLSPPLAVGLILVGCCPGGTASNVVALIGGADVALSVVMTTVSTLVAVVLTPQLTALLAIDGGLLLIKVLQVVLFPVALGVLLKQGLPRMASRVEPVLAPLAVLAIVMIVASIVGSQASVLQQQGARLFLACVLLHGAGFLLGWLVPRLVGEGVLVQRTISIEVGMQNSGLAVVLARSGGFSSPITALPGAISAVIHCLIGSALAALWRQTSRQQSKG